MCALPVYTAQALGCSVGNCLMLALGCMHSLGQATQVQVLGYSTKVQTWLGLRFVPVPGLSSSGDQVFGEQSHLPPPYQQLGFLGVHWVHLLRCTVCLFWGADLWLQPSQWMSTILNPKKSWLAVKSACSLL